MSSKSKVYFFFDNVKVSLIRRTELKKSIERLIKNEGRTLDSLIYVFCTDKKLLSVNIDYLKHDFYTDIITFDLSEKQNSITGEIYISIDRVRENARTFKVSVKGELLRVIFHGALHLCGYKDKTKAEKAIMSKKEDYYLNLYT